MRRIVARLPVRRAMQPDAPPDLTVRRSRGTRALVVIIGVYLLVLLAIVAGREPAAPVPHDPSLAGVVATREFLAQRTVRLVLATGESIDIDLDAARQLDDTGGPDVGQLLFYGVEPDGPWFAIALPAVGGGFELWQSRHKAVDDGTILFESGLRLPIAKNYGVSLTGQMEAGAPVTFLLNEQGEVTGQ